MFLLYWDESAQWYQTRARLFWGKLIFTGCRKPFFSFFFVSVYFPWMGTKNCYFERRKKFDNQTIKPKKKKGILHTKNGIGDRDVSSTGQGLWLCHDFDSWQQQKRKKAKRTSGYLLFFLFLEGWCRSTLWTRYL